MSGMPPMFPSSARVAYWTAMEMEAATRNLLCGPPPHAYKPLYSDASKVKGDTDTVIREDEHMRSGHRTYVAMLRGSMIVFTLAVAVLAAYAFVSAFW